MKDHVSFSKDLNKFLTEASSDAQMLQNDALRTQKHDFLHNEYLNSSYFAQNPEKRNMKIYAQKDG